MVTPMVLDILLGLGGIGLFLIGMVVLTDGLRGLAGSALRRLLVRFTKTPWRGAAAGALATAIVQSSSATTVTAVGFVGAGLLTFPQGVGIVFGANIGTTATGWMVALIGFKLQLGQIALVLVFVGALLRLFGRGRLRHVGWAVAGFGLLFVGIDAMQQGLAQFEGAVTPEDFPDNTLFGRLQLVAIGIAITMVTQSSSAGVAAALVALGAGTISFAQAAALVIGMDIGTTFTAVLATLGGSTPTRQTGYAHVVYNLIVGAIAFFLLGPFADMADRWIARGGTGEAQIAVVAFHTAFNIVGVALLLPFAQSFARLIVRMVPERGPPLLRRIDNRLLSDPASAVEATIATLRDTSAALLRFLTDVLDSTPRTSADPARLSAVVEALNTTRGFLEQVRTDQSDERIYRRHVAATHALDHMLRLSHRCKQEPRIATLSTEPRLRRLGRLLRDVVRASLDEDGALSAEAKFDRLRRLLRRQRRHYRERMVANATRQGLSADITLGRLDAVRWLHRVAYHLWRIDHHLGRAAEPSPAAEEVEQALDEEED